MKIIAIKENHLFSKVYAKGKKASGKNVAVYVLPNYRTGQVRLGITTGKKLGKAHQRSRARRLIREAYRCVLRDFPLKRPYLIVVVARSAIVDEKTKMDHVRADLERAFRKLELFTEREEN